DDVNAGCDVLRSHEIIGGKTVALQNNTVLQYICPEGQYPYPTEYRTCEPGRYWSIMININDIVVSRARCKVIYCPRVAEFENGYHEPPQEQYNINDNITFTCYGGYSMKGSAVRTCLPSGKWSGKTTICYDGTGHCTNPGIPMGSRKQGSRYHIEYRIHYTCDRGLVLYGSKERICQQFGGWSGSEPECRPATQKRKIVIKKGGTMNIYFLLDASKSIKEHDFNSTQNVTIKLIEKISSYDVSPNYAIITFATGRKELFSTTHPQSTDAAWVIDQLQKHVVKPGTNIKKALEAVYEMMISQEADERNHGLNPPPVSNSTRHVIILMSDGRYNMGGDPSPVMNDIKEFLKIKKSGSDNRNEFLDVYVFAVGEINEKTMNDLASKKPGEKHFFKLRDITDLQEAFDDMIDESEVLSMCGLAKEHNTDDQKKNPWNAKITIRRSSGAGFDNCKGTLVSEYFILTAAHSKQDYPVAAVRLHPEYEIGKLKNRGIPEFYDYDVALIKLEKKVEFKNELLPQENIRSFFVSDCKYKEQDTSGLVRRHVQIKNSEMKLDCDQDARNAKLYKNITDISDVVTDNFLCTGGETPVGVISWGVTDVCGRHIAACEEPEKFQRRSPSYARDYHLNLFKVIPWLKEQLADEGWSSSRHVLFPDAPCK
ncbi:putative Complement factor B protein, partial [Naja naja]